MSRIIGVGVDVVSISRIGRILESHGAAFLAKCFSPAEVVSIDSVSSEPSISEYYASRWAAKEAAAKSIGMVRNPRSFLVEKESCGRPIVSLISSEDEDDIPISFCLSLSHDREADAAMAFVVAFVDGDDETVFSPIADFASMAAKCCLKEEFDETEDDEFDCEKYSL